MLEDILMWIVVTVSVLLVEARHIDLQHEESRKDMDNVTKSQFELNWMDMEEILSEADYYKYFTAPEFNTRNVRSAFNLRPGEPSSSHSCCHVRDVPKDLRNKKIMKPNGLDKFYQKYTEAYGIPVIASGQVSDNALRRACYVVRFMFADNKDVRTSYFKRYGRVAVISASEETTDIPEHRWLPKRMNERTRGLGATDYAPVCTAGEENASCFCKDRYFLEDIFVHEVAHGAHLLGAKYAIAGWNTKLINQFESAQRTGLWNNTYAMNSSAEYFAEGVQSYFNVNTHLDKADGVHGPISNRKSLQKYDPALYDLVHEVFPCKNTFLKRCESTRGKELEQELKMNCKESSNEVISKDSTMSDVDYEDNLGLGDRISYCKDNDKMCVIWAFKGECTTNQGYMVFNCQKSCQVCSGSFTDCLDKNKKCPKWSSNGECHKNPKYMLFNCQKSCKVCDSKDLGISNEKTVVINDDTTEKKKGEINTHQTTKGSREGVTIADNEDDLNLTDATTSTQLEKETAGDEYKNNGTTTIAVTVCTDNRQECSMWAWQDECRLNPEYMLYNCKKSCNACGDAIIKECKDWHGQCSVWASSGRCKTQSTYMFDYCKLSCDACESPRRNGDNNCLDENTSCQYWSFIGECVKNKKYMLSKCKRSCKVC
ncbi:unnamed protein product [Mytilus coruscus]|uniref:ShKT domain-containing protein n=1 Tax=Mytilus coruscus TaxID=42192 RepID=A0A6J8E6R9_MYTCO|nr:unnamed protein product [Mytilus coruscus]